MKLWVPTGRSFGRGVCLILDEVHSTVRSSEGGAGKHLAEVAKLDVMIVYFLECFVTLSI